MLGKFVLAKFLPRQTAGGWVSPYLLNHINRIPTSPFLALRLRNTDVGLGSSTVGQEAARVLFIVSSELPQGLDRDCYLTLVSASHSCMLSTDRTLVVHPSLPLPHPRLYLHTYPRLEERNLSDDGPSLPVRLDNAALEVLRRVLAKDDRARRRLKKLEDMRLKGGGGDKTISTEWETWSDHSRSFERPSPPRICVYDYAHHASSATLEKPSVYEELLLYRQLVHDYDWQGCTEVISRICSARMAPHGLSGPGNPLLTAPSADDLRSVALELHSMKIPWDGDPPPAIAPEPEHGGEPEPGDWDYDPGYRFQRVRYLNPSIPVHKPETIVLDLFGTVFDRHTCIEEAIRFLAGHDLASADLAGMVIRFIELEGLRNTMHPDESFVQLSLNVLRSFTRESGVSVLSERIEAALAQLLLPCLHTEALSALRKLRSMGYRLIGVQGLDKLSFEKHFLSSLPLEFDHMLTATHTSRLYRQDKDIFDELRSVTDPATTVVVSTGRFRIAELAHLQGFPVAVIRRAGCLEATAGVDMSPSFVAEDLEDLARQLENPAAAFVTGEIPKRSIPPFRMATHYEHRENLGNGSFGTVYGAFHVLTGEHVAVKLEPIVQNSNPSIPYEVQVYRLLQGLPGFPGLHFGGVLDNAHLLVMDRLGPTLEHLQLVCRGKFSLRTVLMLGLQMLDRIEAAHGRGVVLRDVKPENFAIGRDSQSTTVFIFDFGTAKLYADPTTGEHIQMRYDRDGPGTVRYVSHNAHIGLEQGRRDDIEGLGFTLLHLLHGALPWQGVYAPSIQAKLDRIGEMKAPGSPAFKELMATSPAEFATLFEHCRGLAFEEAPDYKLLRDTFADSLARRGWTNTCSKFDWLDPSLLPLGTLLPGEYKLDVDAVTVDPVL